MDTAMDAAADQPTTHTPTPPTPPTTWSFVQMNMSLLPIARPLPVATACPRRLVQEALEVRKPRTPTQKLHRRVLQTASNISPRRHDNSSASSGGCVRRLSNASLLATAASFRPSPIDTRASTSSPPAFVRCRSEELGSKRGADSASGYASDSSDGPGRPPLASAANAYKGKRILELLDEERRYERSAQQSPTKRSRLQL